VATGSRTQQVFDALSSPTRREVLWLTWDDELTVGEIAAHFELAPPTLSSHLAALRDAGLVSMRVDGNFRRYRTNQETIRAIVPLLAVEDDRWVEADALPEREQASAQRRQLVTVAVDVPVDQSTAFDAFTDGERYSAWLGVPVRLVDGRFAATLEWGTQVRGHYDVVARPDLIAMTWDFDDDAVPVPGRQLVAYLRVHRARRGSRVVVHQHADDDVQASFLTTAWSVVLGRFAAAYTTGAPTSARRRAPRAKRSSS
jgi:DNA-binding transcriptional ArsR family regulator/uncharacterized protein YndB with AHSA1/START domain